MYTVYNIYIYSTCLPSHTCMQQCMQWTDIHTCSTYVHTYVHTWFSSECFCTCSRLIVHQRKSRPSWDRPPTEEEGDMATQEQIKSLHAALVQDAKTGPWGLKGARIPLGRIGSDAEDVFETCNILRPRGQLSFAHRTWT